MDGKNFKKQAVKGSFWNVLASLVQRIGGIVFIVIIARILLPEKFGLYSLVLSTAALFMMLGDKGFNESLIRYFAEAGKNKSKAKTFFYYLLKMKLVVIVGLSALLVLVSYPLSYIIFKEPGAFVPLLISSGYIIFLTYENFLSGLFFAIKKVNYVTWKQTIHQLLRITFVLIIFYFTFPFLSVTNLFIALTLASML